MVIDIIEVLRHKIPLGRFPRHSLEILSELSDFSEYQQGDLIFNIGDKGDSTPYLIWGKVWLKAFDGRTDFIEHTSAESQYGLGILKPRRYIAKAAQNNTKLLWIKSEVLEKILVENQMNHYGVSSLS